MNGTTLDPLRQSRSFAIATAALVACLAPLGLVLGLYFHAVAGTVLVALALLLLAPEPLAPPRRAAGNALAAAAACAGAFGLFETAVQASPAMSSVPAAVVLFLAGALLLLDGGRALAPSLLGPPHSRASCSPSAASRYCDRGSWRSTAWWRT